MKCYFLSRSVDEEGKPVRGYKKRMHNIWKKRYGTEITKQRLREQARISKNEWITKLKLENIRRLLQKEKDIHVNNNGNTGERFYRDEDNTHENKATLVDREDLGEEKDISNLEFRGFNKIDKCALAEGSRKINCILQHIRTENIVDTNILIKAVIVYIGKEIDLKASGSENKKESESWWKRRIKKQINKVRKHINIKECHQREVRRKENIRNLKKV